VELAYRHLRPGGLFITDNVLWSGRVVDEEPAAASTRGVREFTRRLLAHPGFVTSINPTRDGVAVALRGDAG
jgi:predicted O-methyltransferase YrrM